VFSTCGARAAIWHNTPHLDKHLSTAPAKLDEAPNYKAIFINPHRSWSITIAVGRKRNVMLRCISSCDNTIYLLEQHEKKKKQNKFEMCPRICEALHGDCTYQ